MGQQAGAQQHRQHAIGQAKGRPAQRVEQRRHRPRLRRLGEEGSLDRLPRRPQVQGIIGRRRHKDPAPPGLAMQTTGAQDALIHAALRRETFDAQTRPVGVAQHGLNQVAPRRRPLR